jgi:soluble lytic murein transglycosylase-like protein/Zn-dependent protease with chaperone function
VNHLVASLAAALVHFVWQGALVALVAWLALRSATQARARHAVAAIAMLAMTLAPLVTFAFFVARGATRSPAGALVASLPVAPRAASTVPALIAVVWATGVAIASVRLLRGVIEARRLASDSEPLGEVWVDRAARIARALGVTRVVRLASSTRVVAPAALGILRPMILVPASMLTELPVASIEALLAHELAHVARHDALVALAQAAAQALLFYHPAVHWISRELADAREACCDDAATGALGDRLVLARALAAAEVARADRPRLALSSHGGDLVNRIRRLALPSPRARAPRWAAPIVAAAGLFVAGAVPCLACVAAPADGEGTAAARAAAIAVSIPWLPASVQRWAPEIERAARAHDLDPELLAIVTLVESNGDPAAVSPGGSVGLAQVMPKTAAKIAARRGLDGAGDLRDPATNLDYGASYLADQLRAFGSVELAAAAYNGGPDAVHAWLDGRSPLSDETDHYKSKVARLWQARHEASRPAR